MFEKIKRLFRRAVDALSNKQGLMSIGQAVENLKPNEPGTKYVLECTPAEGEQIDMILADIREREQDLSRLSPEERKKVFETWAYPRALDFDLDLGSTLLHVNSKFNEHADEDIVTMVNRVIETQM